MDEKKSEEELKKENVNEKVDEKANEKSEKKSIRKGRKERVQDFLLPMRRCSRILDINTVAVIRFYSHLAGNYKK